MFFGATFVSFQFSKRESDTAIITSRISFDGQKFESITAITVVRRKMVYGMADTSGRNARFDSSGTFASTPNKIAHGPLKGRRYPE
jgi:hypothetical protein